MSDGDHIAVSSSLWLAPIVANDRDGIVEHLNDSAVSRWMLRVPYPYESSDFDSFLGIAGAAAKEVGAPLHFTIHHTEYGPIGGFGFERLVPGHCVEIGYWLGQAYWGQGIMPQVVKAGCQHAVTAWKVVRISACIFDGNTASASVLEKCGFQREGLLRCHDLKDGQLIDAVVYARIVE
ncbi:MAG: GNAT family N-acetyltransferase [Planctomycetota bacterium]